MLVHDKTNKTPTTAPATVEPPSPTGLPAEDGPVSSRPAHRPRRRVRTLAATGALVGIVTIAIVTSTDQQETDRSSVSDGSSEVAEANRMATLGNLPTGSVSDGSSEVAEANRMATLRDLATAQ